MTSTSQDSRIDFAFLRLPTMRRLGRLAPQAIPYIGYLLFHIVLSPFLAVQGVIRAKRRVYKGHLWPRFWGASDAKPGSVVLLAGGMGELRIANQLAHEIGKISAYPIAMVVNNYVPAPPSSFGPVGAAPFNSPFSVFLFLVRTRPQAILAPEFCDNVHLKFAARLLGIPLVIFNVNTTDREVARRKRWSAWRWQIAGLYVTQNETQRERLLAIGVATDQIVVLGSVGVYLEPPSNLAEVRKKWRDEIGFGGVPGPIVLCGSTHAGDEQVLLPAWDALLLSEPNATMILAPRNDKNFEKVYSNLEARGNKVARRSLGQLPEAGGIYLLDSQGELAGAYSVADVASIGATFDHWRGGHTAAEALMWGVPLTLGPYYQVQANVIDALVTLGIAQVCATSEELKDAWLKYVRTPGLRQEIVRLSAELGSSSQQNGPKLLRALGLAKPQG